MDNAKFAERYYSYWLAKRDYEAYCAAKQQREEHYRQLSIFPHDEMDTEPWDIPPSPGAMNRYEIDSFDASDVEEF